MSCVEIEVWLFAVALCGAAVAGAGLAWLWNRRREAQHAAELSQLKTRATRAESDAHDASVASRRSAQQVEDLTAKLDNLLSDHDQLKAELDHANTQLQRHNAHANVTAAQLLEFEKRFSDVVGLESEIATLRVIASRVPELERRLTEATGDETVIDLRSDRAQVTE